MIIRYKATGRGTEARPWKTDLPEYKRISQISASPRVWEVEVPDDYGLRNRLVNKMIHKKYKYTKKELKRIPLRERKRVEDLSTIDYEAEQIIP